MQLALALYVSFGYVHTKSIITLPYRTPLVWALGAIGATSEVSVCDLGLTRYGRGLREM